MRLSKMVRMAAALTLIVPQIVRAHVVLETQHAKPGSYFKVVFVVPHGCDGSPTTALRVELPPGIVIAKPMPKPGWALDIAKEPLAKPVQNEGHAITERVKEIVWQGGKLSSDEYDTFSMMVRLPDTQGRLYFPVRQICETGNALWVEIPSAGKTSRDVRYPAPSVMLALSEAAE